MSQVLARKKKKKRPKFVLVHYILFITQKNANIDNCIIIIINLTYSIIILIGRNGLFLIPNYKELTLFVSQLSMPSPYVLQVYTKFKDEKKILYK